MKNPINPAIADYKAVEQSLDELQEAKRNAQAKIDDCHIEIQRLTDQKAEIESELANAADQILKGSMTNSEYSGIKRRLLEVNELINDQQAFAEVFTQKLNDEFSTKQNELMSELRHKKRLANAAITQDQAVKVVAKCGSELEELAALVSIADVPHMDGSVPSSLGARDRYMLALGRRLAMGLYGGSFHNAVWQPPQQSQKLIKEVLKRVGIS